MATPHRKGCRFHRAGAICRRLRCLVLGRQFMRSLEANQTAAENLDAALKEMLGQ